MVGSHVTDTIRKGIVDPAYFTFDPMIFVYGALAALIGAALFVSLSTFLRLPVSTTHAIVGGILGFGLISAGFDSVNVGKLTAIVLSWIVSPVMGAVIAFVLFMLISKLILNSDHPLESTKKFIPPLVFMVFIVLSLSILLKSPRLKLDVVDALFYSILFSGFIAVLAYLVVRFSRRISSVDDQYKPVEKLFGYLQVLSACCVAFAHGGNDVANAVGLVAAVLSVLQTGSLEMSVPVPLWLLALGGVGLAVGICTFGYRVMMTIGERITEITPTRGFAAEFGAATTVLVCSKMGLPISTSHTVVGSVIGVGFARGINALNLEVIRDILIAWFLTVPVAALTTIVLFKLILFALGVSF